MIKKRFSMRILRLPLIVCFSFALTNIGFSQRTPSLTRDEAFSYPNVATAFLDVHDNGRIQNTELVLMFLENDDSGRVTAIHLMADNKNKHSLYHVLKEMKPADFHIRCTNKGAANKVVIVPVYSIKFWKNEQNYMDKLRMPFCPFIKDNHAIQDEADGYILVAALPHIIRDPRYEKLRLAQPIDTTQAGHYEQ